MSAQTTTMSCMSSAELQAQAYEIGENITDMMRTELRIADGSGWNDERIERIERDITRWQSVRANLLTQLQERRKADRRTEQFEAAYRKQHAHHSWEACYDDCEGREVSAWSETA